jgi:hypothetical protein
MAPLARFDLAAPRRYSDRAPIFMAFRGPQAQANQLRKSSQTVRQLLKLQEIHSVFADFGPKTA